MIDGLDILAERCNQLSLDQREYNMLINKWRKKSDKRFICERRRKKMLLNIEFYLRCLQLIETVSWKKKTIHIR